MKKYRYGEFKIRDCYIPFLIATICLITAFLGFILDVIHVLMPLAFACALIAIIHIITILISYKEQFILNTDHVVSIKGRKVKKIDIPFEATLVISYADICPPLAKRNFYSNNTHIIKDRYAVTILRKMPTDNVLADLHKNRVKMYTTSMLASIFAGYRYIYCFVCDQDDLEHLITNRKCSLIIPESLLHNVNADFQSCDVCIDVQC